jgi:hypothetical protein
MLNINKTDFPFIYSNIPAAHAYDVDIYEATKPMVPNE